MRALPLLLLAALVAGCAAPAVPEPTETLPPAATDVWVHKAGRVEAPLDSFGPLPRFEQLHVTSRISGEPTIGVTRTGAVFYPSIDFDVGVGGRSVPSVVYFRSVDGGATWEDFSPHVAGVRTHATSFDPYVYVDPTTGRVFAMDMGPHVACNKVSWSDNDGRTWTTRDGACPIPVADHPTLFAAPRDVAAGMVPGAYPNTVFLCSNQVADVQCSMSPDGGLTWLPSQPVFVGVESGRVCGSLTGHGHASFVDGTIYIGKAHCGVPMAGISRDGGLTWTTAVIAQGPEYQPRGEHDVSIGTDLDGTAYAFWIGNGTTAWLSRSTDKGATWTTPVDVTAPGVTAAKLPSLVAGASGRIAFLYVGTTTPSGFAATEQEKPDEWLNATWNAYVGMSLDANEDDALYATTTANDLDRPLKRGSCDGRCFGDIGGMYDFLDIDIDPMTGRVWVALVDVCTGDCESGDARSLQRAMGAVGKQVGGVFLLDEPFPRRT